MPSEAKKTIPVLVRIDAESNRLLRDLRRAMSLERAADLSLGDVVAESLKSLEQSRKESK